MIAKYNTSGNPSAAPESFENFYCDMCGIEVPKVARWAAYAKGATGRVCEVMWACEACGKKHGFKKAEGGDDAVD